MQVYAIGVELLHPDPEGEMVSLVSIDQQPLNGAVTLLNATALRYDHDGSDTTADVIGYTIEDSFGNQSTGRLVLTITPVNDPPQVAGGVADALASVPIEIRVAASDVDGSVVSMSATGLPAGLSAIFDAGTEELVISGTADGSVRDSTASITVTAIDDEGASSDGVVEVAFDPIALSPHIGRVQITEILFHESEKWNPGQPNDHTYLMDEYIEWTMVDNVDLRGWHVTDRNPYLGTDADYYPFGYSSPLDAGTLNENWSTTTAIFVAGDIITTSVRWPFETTFPNYDGTTQNTLPFSSWWFSHPTDYWGFFPASGNSKWQAFNDVGDDLWIFDGDGLLVDYVAWNDGNGQAHVDAPPLGLGIWDPVDEARLASAVAGQSISLAVLTPAGARSSACWEPTGSGTATCAGAFVTQDLDAGEAARPASLARVSSQGQPND